MPTKICFSVDLSPGKCQSGLNALLIRICDYLLNQDHFFRPSSNHPHILPKDAGCDLAG